MEFLSTLKAATIRIFR